MPTRTFNIYTMRLDETDLRLAYSPDLRGLLVPARSDGELVEILPAAIAEILEARGEASGPVSIDPAPEGAPGPFGKGRPTFRAHVQLTA